MLAEMRTALFKNLLSGCEDHYGSDLVTLAVYGSAGRGTMHQYSDLDILIVARNLPKGRIARINDFQMVEDGIEDVLASVRGEGWYVELSPVLKTPGEVEQGGLLYLDMIDDAEILYDEDGYFESYLETFSKKLESLHARKHRWKGGWYWEVKPDIKPGEVVEI